MAEDVLVFELANPTEQLLTEVADTVFKQKDVAATYALALRCSTPTDWRKVNAAIIERWSRSGLQRIKQAAWKKHEVFLSAQPQPHVGA